MKKLKMFFAVLMVLTLMACASFTANTYKSIYMAGSTYNLIMNSVASLEAQGKITVDQRAKINQYAKVYYDSYELAVKAFETYDANASSTNQTALINSLYAAINNWALLANVINDAVPSTANVTSELSTILAQTK